MWFRNVLKHVPCIIAPIRSRSRARTSFLSSGCGCFVGSFKRRLGMSEVYPIVAACLRIRVEVYTMEVGFCGEFSAIVSGDFAVSRGTASVCLRMLFICLIVLFLWVLSVDLLCVSFSLWSCSLLRFQGMFTFVDFRSFRF